MLVIKNSKKLKKLFKKKQKGVVPLEENFNKLMEVFQHKLWNEDANILFKKMFENLFLAYGIRVKVHIKTRESGDGTFYVEFLDSYQNKNTWQRKVKKFFTTLFNL